jgi:hypothetical protein
VAAEKAAMLEQLRVHQELQAARATRLQAVFRGHQVLLLLLLLLLLLQTHTHA